MKERRVAQRRSEANTTRSEAGPERRSFKDRRVASRETEPAPSPVLQAVLDAISGKLDTSTQIADHPNVKFALMERLKLTAALAAAEARHAWVEKVAARLRANAECGQVIVDDNRSREGEYSAALLTLIRVCRECAAALLGEPPPR